jgi:hypothetical protein
MKNPNDKTNIDFYKIYQDAIAEYEEMVGHSVDDGDYPDYILYAMHKVFMMKVNNEPMPRLS